MGVGDRVQAGGGIVSDKPDKTAFDRGYLCGLTHGMGDTEKVRALMEATLKQEPSLPAEYWRERFEEALQERAQKEVQP